MKVTIIEGPQTEARLQMAYRYIVKVYNKEIQAALLEEEQRKGENDTKNKG